MKGEERISCSRCGALLAIVRQGRVHVKVRAAQYIVEGTHRITAFCGKCQQVNEF